MIDALRSLDRLRDKGKVHPAFHFKSKAFLHFHRDDQGAIYADVRFDRGWEKKVSDMILLNLSKLFGIELRSLQDLSRYRRSLARKAAPLPA